MGSGFEEMPQRFEAVSEETRQKIIELAESIVRATGFAVSFNTELGKNPNLTQILPQLEAEGLNTDSILVETAKGDLVKPAFMPIFLDEQGSTPAELTVRIGRVNLFHFGGLTLGYSYQNLHANPVNYTVRLIDTSPGPHYIAPYAGAIETTALSENEGLQIIQDLEILDAKA